MTLPKRERKYRFWNGKKMLYDIYFDSWGGQANEVNEIIQAFNNSEDGRLTEFTGLLDKNRKEIWEGDIMQVDDQEDTSTFIVIFEEGAFRKNYMEWQKGTSYLVIDNLDLKQFMVIGNIFQNPKLIKKI